MSLRYRFEQMFAGVLPLTPNKVVSLGLLFVGIIALIGGRFVFSGDWSHWAGIGLLFWAASFYVDGIFPGGSEPTAQQIAAIVHNGIPYRPGMEKAFSLVMGTIFLLGGLYLAVW